MIGLGKLVTVSEAILTREGALEEGDGGSTNFAKGVPLHSRHRRMGPEKRMIGVQITGPVGSCHSAKPSVDPRHLQPDARLIRPAQAPSIPVTHQ